MEDNKDKHLFFITVSNQQFEKERLEIDGELCKPYNLGLKSKSKILKISDYKFIYEINKIPKKEGDIKFTMSIVKSEEIQNDKDPLLERNKINYNIKSKDNQKEKDIIFLFDYSIDDQKNKLIENIKIWWNIEKITFSEKFLIYFEYLLQTKDDYENDNKYYINLVNDFISARETNKNNDKLDLEIIISILISAYYDKDFGILKKFHLDKNNIDIANIRENNLIKSYNEIYLTQIGKCLNKVNSENYQQKNLIIEMIIIYFIKFDYDNIKNYLFSKIYKGMITNFFKERDNLLVLDEILDEKITQIIIENSSGLENIISVLKTSKNFIEYLRNIDKNFDIINKEINSFKFKKIFDKFRINFNVSQSDDINEFEKIHTSLLEKQKNNKFYFIDFIYIFENYYNIYDKYNNLSYICSLEKMVEYEIEIISQQKSKALKIYKDIQEKYKKK